MTISNFDVRDAAGTTQQVGTFDDGTQQHPTNVQLSAEIEEVTGVTLTSTPTVVTISPQATYLIVDYGDDVPTGATSGNYGITGTFTTAGATVPLDWWYHTLAWQTGITRIERPGNSGVTLPSAQGPRWFSDAVDTTLGKVVVVPLYGGVKTVNLYGGFAGSTTNVAYRQMAGPVPQRPERQYILDVYAGGSLVSSTTYSAGDVIGGNYTLGNSFPWAGLARSARPVLRGMTFGSYNCNLVDFDIVLSGPGYNNGQINNAPAEFTYPEGIHGWYECRTAPAAGQYRVRASAPTGEQTVQIPDLFLPSIWAVKDASSAFYWDLHIIDRTGVTLGSAPALYVEGQTEL